MFICERARLTMSENSEQFNSIFVPKTVSEILGEVSMIDDLSEKSSKLDFHVFSLEEEMRKVDAFKRELPHCMHLLKDAIETLKKEKMETTLKGRTEELDGRAKESNDINEKKNWMSCIQLWSTPIQYENTILPLKPQKKEVEPRRKQRRCWSPQLHNRFVDALLHLGGPQTATPKQIRELMKVDGLTNDEVKSHLQKYRLHIRKVPSTSGELPWWLNEESSKRIGTATPQGGSASAMEDHKLTWKGRF